MTLKCDLGRVTLPTPVRP